MHFREHVDQWLAVVQAGQDLASQRFLDIVHCFLLGSGCLSLRVLFGLKLCNCGLQRIYQVLICRFNLSLLLDSKSCESFSGSFGLDSGLGSSLDRGMNLSFDLGLCLRFNLYS